MEEILSSSSSLGIYSGTLGDFGYKTIWTKYLKVLNAVLLFLYNYIIILTIPKSIINDELPRYVRKSLAKRTGNIREMFPDAKIKIPSPKQIATRFAEGKYTDTNSNQ